MRKIIQNYMLSAAMTISIAHADSYQHLLKTFNKRESAELLQKQIGNNLAKRVATDAERSNLSFIAIYAELAQRHAGKSLQEQILAFTQFSHDQINDASLSSQEKQYRTNHYVHLVVLTVAAHNPLPSANMLSTLQTEIRSLQSSLHPDVYNQLMGLNDAQIQKILSDFNFNESLQLAKADIELQETLKGNPDAIMQRLLRLIPDKVIEYQKAFEELNDVIKQYQDRQTARSAGSLVTPSSNFKGAKASLQTALLNRLNQPPVRADSVNSSSTEEKKDGAVAGSVSTRASLNAMLLNRKKQPSVTTSSDDDPVPNPKAALGALFAGGGDRRSKAEEMRRKSIAEMGETVVSASKGAVNTANAVEDSTEGGWTTDRLQADAIRQIQTSELSDDLTEDAYDEDENEIKISPKEKAIRDVTRLIKSNKQRIEGGILTIDQLAMQITDFLSKKGFNTYINPVATKAPTGYKRPEKAHSKVTGTTSASKNTGPSLAEQAQKKLAEMKSKQSISDAASASITPEMKAIFDENIDQYDQLQNEISESESKTNRLHDLIIKKRKDLEKMSNRGTSSDPLTEEAKHQIRQEIDELNQKIEIFRREIQNIEAEDNELASIPAALKSLNSSELSVREKTQQREQLAKRKTELEGPGLSKSKERKTNKSTIKQKIDELNNEIEIKKRKIGLDATAEELNARQKALDEEIATAEAEYAGIQEKIRNLNVQAIEIFTSKGLTVAASQFLLEKRQKDKADQVAQADAGMFRFAMEKRASLRPTLNSDNESSDSDDEDKEFSDDD